MKNRIRLGKEDGAAAVEFALIVGVLSLLIFGMMEYGLAFTQIQSLKAGVREGARTAAVRADRPTIESAMITGTGGSLPSSYNSEVISVNGSTVSGNGPFCTSTTAGQNVTVQIPTGSGSSYDSLPSNIVESFKIDIPFMPHLDLHPQITGSFRCE